MENKKRVNYYLVEDVWKFIEEQANEMGISQSAFITMVMLQYRQQSQAVSGIKNMSSILDSLEDIKARLSDLEDK